jgi:hypothetical protein
MKNVSFALTAGVVVLVSLGAAALRYNLQVPRAVHPALIVYHDNALLPGHDQRSSDRYWTLAVRSDGSSMQVNSVPDASGHIEGVKSLEFRDRYVVVDPVTMSTSTYKPYRPMIGGTRDCLGTHAGSVLGHPVEYVHEVPKNEKSTLKVRERWYAVDLNCIVLREHLTDSDPDGKTTQFYREAVSVKLGEPPDEFFVIPLNYQERGPAEVNNELERGSGRSAFPNQASVDAIQKVYESGRLK